MGPFPSILLVGLSELVSALLDLAEFEDFSSAELPDFENE